MARIEALRRTHKWPAARITQELVLDRISILVRTVSRNLAHLGLNRRRVPRPETASNREPRRIMARWPGHMVHVDIERVGQIPDGGGWRVPCRGSDQAKKVERAKTAVARAGYVYLHSAVDGFSRLAFTEALSDEKAATASCTSIVWSPTTARAIAQGLRESPARWSPSADHPYTSRNNGKVERYNRILAEEFLYARTWASEQQRAEAPQVWDMHDNYRLIVEASTGSRE